MICCTHAGLEDDSENAATVMNVAFLWSVTELVLCELECEVMPQIVEVEAREAVRKYQPDRSSALFLLRGKRWR